MDHRRDNHQSGVAVSASVFTITVMSIDRYLAIRHPMSRKIINRRTTRKVILCLWTLSLVIFSPILFIRKMRKSVVIIADQKYEENFCVESWPDNIYRKTFGTFCFVVVYAIPGIIVVLAYSLMGLRLCSRHLLPEYQVTQGMSSCGASNGLSQFDASNSAWQVSSASGRLIRERRRVAKILLILALVFAMCWLPYSVLSLILDLANQEDEVEVLALSLLPFAILLGHVNSAVNPLLYCLLSKNFRRSVTELVRHPTRAFRNRQPHKIRMTFRKDPPEVKLKDKNSSKDHSSTRPRNHHTPDPSEAQNGSGSLGPHGCASVNRTILGKTGPNCLDTYFTEPAELCVVDIMKINRREGCGNSPSSSGYSSMRHSMDALTTVTMNKDNSNIHSCSHYQRRKDDRNCQHCFSWNSALCLAEQTNTKTSKRNLTDSVFKRHDLPSTICEESDSVQRNKVSFPDFFVRDMVST